MADPVFDVPVPSRPSDLEERTAALLAALDSRILVLDGATGTAGLGNLGRTPKMPSRSSEDAAAPNGNQVSAIKNPSRDANEAGFLLPAGA